MRAVWAIDGYWTLVDVRLRGQDARRGCDAMAEAETEEMRKHIRHCKTRDKEQRQL